MSEEFDRCLGELAFRRVDGEMELPKTFKDLSQVRFVLVHVVGGDAYIVDVDKDEIESTKNCMHESLERLRCISQSKRHVREFKKAERRGDCRLWDVTGLDWNLVVRTIEIDVAEHFFSMQKVREVLNMW